MLQSAMRLEASSRASRTSDRPAPPMAVCVLTPRLVCVARWKRRSRPDDVVPSSRALSSARPTCPAISSSPTTTDSSPLVTAKRWVTTSSLARTVTAPRRSAEATPLARLIASTAALVAASAAASSMSRYASKRLQVARTTAPCTASVLSTRPWAASGAPNDSFSSRSKLVLRWFAVRHRSTS